MYNCTPITEATRFTITAKGRDAIRNDPIAPGCPLCGSPLEKVYDSLGAFYECENAGIANGGCFYTITARELEAFK